MAKIDVRAKEIITDLDELNKLGRAREIDPQKENKEMREIISSIKKTMRKNNLTSLSAPAIGYDRRIFCIDYSDLEIKTYINPIISYAEGLELSREICSSIPNKEYIRPRNSIVDVYYTTPKGEIKNQRFKGLASFVIQHEIDHLEGINLDDIGLEIEEDFDNATEEERIEVIDMYIDSLDIKRNELQKDIEADEELFTVAEKLRFEEALVRGDITLEEIKEDEIN